MKPRWSTRLKQRAGAERERVLKFLVVGALAFVVDTGSLSVFVLLCSMDRTLAKGLSFSLAVLASFAGNHLWTFQGSRSKSVAKKAVQFAAVSIGGLGVNVAVFSTVQPVATGLWGSVPGLYAGQVMAVGAAMFWNFLANRFITYNDLR